jgi:hypothetical protein
MTSGDDSVSGREMRRNEATEHLVDLRLTRVGAEKVIRSCHQDYRRHGGAFRCGADRGRRPPQERGDRAVRKRLLQSVVAEIRVIR